jgi:hypothetical protein
MTRNRSRLVSSCAWLLLACAAALGCKSSAETCQRQITDCLKRCDQRGADADPAPGAPIEHTMSQCEANCQNCRDEAPPPPTPKPTPTGYEQQP